MDEVAAPTSPATKREATSLRELSPTQWKSGIAAWLGWLFDGLDMHIYTLVATPFVAALLMHDGVAAAPKDVDTKASIIQAAFLVGWALRSRRPRGTPPAPPKAPRPTRFAKLRTA